MFFILWGNLVGKFDKGNFNICEEVYFIVIWNVIVICCWEGDLYKFVNLLMKKN